MNKQQLPQPKAVLEQSHSLMAISINLVQNKLLSWIPQSSKRDIVFIKKLNTGLVAYVDFQAPTKVVIWDCKYECMVGDSIDFIMPIDRIIYMRNILVVINDMRIIVRDFVLDQNIVYIPVHYGVKSFVSSYFQLLKIGYFPEENQFCSLAIWSDKRNVLKDIMFIQGGYDYKGELMILRGQEFCDIYKDDIIIHKVNYKKGDFLGWIFDGVMLDKISNIFFIHREAMSIFQIFTREYLEDMIKITNKSSEQKSINNNNLDPNIYENNKIDNKEEFSQNNLQNEQSRKINFVFTIQKKQWKHKKCQSLFFEVKSSQNKLHIIQKAQHTIVTFLKNS